MRRVVVGPDSGETGGMSCSIEDLQRVDIRVGEVVQAERFSAARKPALLLHIDFGELGIRKSSAQITDHYEPEAWLIGPIMSLVLVLGGHDDVGAGRLAGIDGRVPNGARLC